ncbi:MULTISPECIES: low temperature requirement protein A [unclassified Streptomyces]|uniref:low temperature requirement protein A n=1 Tax=unclassified Streptomyces TaxID=2593676 RepID=UPI002E2F6A53|nr:MULTISPECIES: low temperature requirement protein A [unclassified Streptomyces]WUC62861.1 low temperature requirement protein A [Streptomyces sp. NBC_00539]
MSSVPESLRLRREVSPLELFYDLVFVFAVSQLSHHLLEHLTRRGSAETAVLLVAVEDCPTTTVAYEPAP